MATLKELETDYQGIIYQWKTDEINKDKKLYEDIADEYVIVRKDSATGGLIVFASYGDNRGFIANPWSNRHLIAYLLSEIERLESYNCPTTG